MESVKRIKLDNPTSLLCRKMICKSILPDEMLNLPELEDFYVGSIDDPKIISKILPELNEKLPIQQIQFLKRVHKREILLCSREDFNLLVSEFKLTVDETLVELFRKILELKEISKDLSEKMCSAVRSIQVPGNQPTLRWQYDKIREHWPSKFHENKYQESLAQNSLFSCLENEENEKFMKTCLFLSEKVDGRHVGLAVNHYTKKIVAIGVSRTKENPIFHCSMVLTDQVAISQGGGVWAKQEDEEILKLKGLVLDQFPETQFGEDPFDKEKAEKFRNHEDNLLKYGPYLCTGYHIYLTMEPCLMCAMALTHSRAKRVFYHTNNKNRGALGSLTKLHTQKNLNHHYEVFQMHFID